MLLLSAIFIIIIIIFRLYISVSAACNAEMDLAFLVDGSSSVEKYAAGNFQRIIGFVRGLTMGFAISQSVTRVSLIVYGTRPKVIFGFPQ